MVKSASSAGHMPRAKVQGQQEINAMCSRYAASVSGFMHQRCLIIICSTVTLCKRAILVQFQGNNYVVYFEPQIQWQRKSVKNSCHPPIKPNVTIVAMYWSQCPGCRDPPNSHSMKSGQPCGVPHPFRPSIVPFSHTFRTSYSNIGA